MFHRGEYRHGSSPAASPRVGVPIVPAIAVGRGLVRTAHPFDRGKGAGAAIGAERRRMDD